MFHFIYKTVNTINGRYYIGRHSTENVDDGYLGSGIFLKKALEKYGRNSFSRTILAFYETFEDLRQAEHDLVDCILDDPQSYNVGKGGWGGQPGQFWTEERKANLSKAIRQSLNTEEVRRKKKLAWDKRRVEKPTTAEARENMRESAKKAWKDRENRKASSQTSESRTEVAKKIWEKRSRVTSPEVREKIRQGVIARAAERRKEKMSNGD